MRTREKVLVLVVIATLVLGALIFIAFRENEVEANHFRWLLANQIKYGLSFPGKFLDELPSGSLLYGGVTVFAVFMVIIVLKMVRDGEIQALRRHLLNLRAAKNQAESLLQEEVWKGKHERQARDSVKKDLETSIEKIELLIVELNEKERLLKTRERELMTAKSSSVEFADSEPSSNPAERDELKKKNEILQSQDSTIKELGNQLSAKIRLWESQLREKDGLLKGREQELDGLRSEIVELGERLTEVEAAKRRADDLLQEELRQKKEVLEANDLATRTERKRLSERIRALENQVSEKERLLRTRDTELNGFRGQLTEMESAKEQMESRLQEEIGKFDQDRRAKEKIINDLEQRSGTSIHALRTEVGEKDLLLQARDGELKSLTSEVKAISRRLSEMAAAKVRAEETLQEELRKEKQQRAADRAHFREREEHHDKEINLLAAQVNERDEFLKSREGEIKALKQEVKTVTLRLEEIGAAKERDEASLQKGRQEEKQRREANELSGIKRVEEDLAGKLRGLESQLREKGELLQSREAQIDAFKNQIDELARSKEHAARTLQDDLRQKTELLDEKAAAIDALEERFSTRIHTLESALNEKQEIIEARDAALKEFASKANMLSGELVELETSKDHATRLLHEDLRQKTELLQSKESSMKALDERLTGKIRSLEKQVSQKQQLLAARDTELDALMAKVSELTQKVGELGAERERSDRLIQEELHEKTAMLQSKENSIGELEERLKGRVDSLERQVADKQKLLEASGVELSDLRAQISGVTERLNETEAAKVYLERLVQQERHKADEMSVSVETSQGEASDGMNGEAHDLDALLGERETLLKARDKLIQDLMSELKDKKKQLARQEIEVLQKIERREAWKHRLSKFGIRIRN